MNGDLERLGMNLRGIDLNLLVVLNALLEEAHVTRAAERLALSQPAASSALERCRHLFKDPLLERHQGRMRLTAKAESLREPLRHVLDGVSAIVAPAEVELADVQRVIRLAMGDYPAVLLASALLGRLRLSAPGIDLVLLPWQGGAEAAEALRQGHADIAVSVLPPPDGDTRRSQLLQESYRVVMAEDHPAASDFDLDPWLEHPHIVVSGRGERHSPLDDLLFELGRSRRVGLVVPSFMMVGPLLQGSDLIAMLPTRCIPRGGGLASFEPPVSMEGFPLHMARHRRTDRDIAVQHVAELIAELLV